MMGFSIWKLLIILGAILLVFGGRNLPELGKGLGEGLANFRKSFKDEERGSGEPEKISSKTEA